jgi:hypothetical protein
VIDLPDTHDVIHQPDLLVTVVLSVEHDFVPMLDVTFLSDH